MRKFFAKTAGLWRTLAIVFALIFAVFFVVGSLLEANAAQVNRVLGTSTSVILAGEGETTYDKYTPDETKYTDEDGNWSTDNLVEEHKRLGEQVGAEGSVLLQNDEGALPLDKSSDKITLFGVASTAAGGYYGMIMGGTVNSSQNVSLYDALTTKGANVNKDMSDYYESQASSMSGSANNINTFFTVNDAVQERYQPFEAKVDSTLVGEYSDVGIVVIGRPSSEGGDYNPGSLGLDTETTGARTSLALTSDELAMIDAAKNACKKTVVLVNACNAMELGPIMTGGAHAVDAILWVGFPGNYGYLGVADVLLGTTNPSGHLTDTYAYDSTSAPAMQNFGYYRYSNVVNGFDEDSEYADNPYKYPYYVGNTNYGNYYVVEAEGIYIGYKYYETRYEDAVMGDTAASSSAGVFESTSGWNYGEEVAYSFGYGMSYTTFDQTITSVEFSDDMRTATVNVTVTNTGEVAGRSVVQVYGQSPYTAYDKQYGVEKASVQLLNYGKTGVIESGKTEDISIDIDMQLLASYDSGANEGEGTYIMENTTSSGSDHYYFALGCNDNQEGAHAAVNNILAAKGKTSGSGSAMDADGNGGTNGSTATWLFDWDESQGYSSDLFATSKEGVPVTNQLDTADLNSWDCGTTVTYLSRSDWEWKENGTGPSLWDTDPWAGDWSDGKCTPTHLKGYTDVNVTAEMVKWLNSKVYDVKTDDDVSGVLFDMTEEDDPKYNLTFADMIDENGKALPYDDDKWDILLDELNLEEAVWFVAMGNREYQNLTTINFLGGSYVENGPNGTQLTLPSSYEAPWFTPKDPNNSYSWNDMGAEPLQAATFDHDLLWEIGELWGNDSLFVNMPLLWAPSLNLHRTQYNGRTAEYYSEDPILTGYSALEVVKGAEKRGLICTIKHYAANDQEGNRYGISAYMSEQQMRENELRGFQIAFEGGAKAVMTSYNRIGPVYSGANEGLMEGILRGEWAYHGYAISDFVPYTEDYMTFTESVLHTTSTFDKNTTYDGSTASSLANKYAGDATMLKAIKEAVHNTLWTFANSNVVNYMTAGATRIWVANWWRVTYITIEVVGGVVACASVVLYVISRVVGKKDDDEEEA